ncbi:AcrR family transcriptional regulator [Lewinella marina]|uniref:TetR family transcriptional regulator n=1 Tax=Neolewinella marina TaxID=438751 RepID=A0A2G0CCP5_9BACT|nr:TetR/AcrR family transcriptional regulator [Neolewinella marina]NJB87557.1 AcrR family transcriptional regulator [Neolewinella marina]PHK97751.1 TetR family transcriptional regulator [Neolewinella marina]
MDVTITPLVIAVCPSLYLKDPETSKLGKRIVAGAIDLVDEIGLEQFTFRKLAVRVGTTEASVYRYFENKHKLLLYLVMWYWGWMDHRLTAALAGLPTAEDRLRRAIRLLTETVAEDSDFSHVNEVKLNRIVVAESLKVYLTRAVDEDNRQGAFQYYKQLVERVSGIIREVNPTFAYPHMLVTTIIEGGHLQRHFSHHLPRITDAPRDGEDAVVCFFTHLAFKTIS